MNIFVCIRQVPDSRSIIRPMDNGEGIETEGLHWVLNPEDECAVEQALLLREQAGGGTVTLLHVGDGGSNVAIITALAMGADHAVHVTARESELDPFMTARAIQGAIKHCSTGPDLVLCGSQAFGDESGVVPQLLASLLGIPCINQVSKCRLENRQLLLVRIVESATTETYRSGFPLLVACKYGIKTPRYTPLPHLQAAARKPVLRLALADTGVSADDRRLDYKRFRRSPDRKGGRIFNASDRQRLDAVIRELVATIRSELDIFSTRTPCR